MKLRTEPRNKLVALEGDPVSRLVPIFGLITKGEEIQEEAAEASIGIVAQKFFSGVRFDRADAFSHPVDRLVRLGSGFYFSEILVQR